MKRELQNQVNALVLQVLFRGFRVLYKHDERVRKEMDAWKDGLTLKLVCGPGGAVLAMRKSERTGVAKLHRAQRTAITMRFKSVEGAFRVLTGQMSVSQAYAEAYLFPRFWSRRILKEVPEKELSALRVYVLALLEDGR